MQFVRIDRNTTLADLSKMVGQRNVDAVLALNQLERTVDVGAQFYKKCEDIKTDPGRKPVDLQRKATILNTFVDSYDAFELASLGEEWQWRMLDSLSTFYMCLRLPEGVVLQVSTGTIGEETPVPKVTYDGVMEDLLSGREIDVNNFSEVQTHLPSVINTYDPYGALQNDIQAYMHLPWGKITLHSFMDDETIDIPAYPENYSDNRRANYEEMPSVLYQYEPWFVYKSSGSRSNSFKFHLHRDMWSGDRRDGKANELIRFCEAHCYPRYNGSAVNVPKVELLIDGKCVISGIMNNVTVDWGGAIATSSHDWKDDNWYLEFTLTLEITEISKFALNYDVVKALPLIG